MELWLGYQLDLNKFLGFYNLNNFDFKLPPSSTTSFLLAPIAIGGDTFHDPVFIVFG